GRASPPGSAAGRAASATAAPGTATAATTWSARREPARPAPPAHRGARRAPPHSLIPQGHRMNWRIGVDSGGTFTDVYLFEEGSGRTEIWKVSSTPDDPSRGIAQGVAEALQRVGATPDAVGYFGHGTTVGTNALIQLRGVPTGLITTDGFRDLLEIGRQKRPELYDLQADKPPVLVARDLRLEVPERVRHDGSVETALDEQAVREAARALREAGVRSVAI